MRITWLADALRDEGLRVVEVEGWKTRGSSDFDPIGVTWHATAGSRRATAAGEVGVILNGSASAPPPIAQLMLWRDGTFYVCAAGRCNHNKTGWAGPNKGLGNTQLVGLEMANDNRGEPWPDAQLDAARRGTAAIFRRLGTDPSRRLAAHYEHQPSEGRPPGETSTKTDPAGVRMSDERARVYALMTRKGGFLMALTEKQQDELYAWMRETKDRLNALTRGMPKTEDLELDVYISPEIAGLAKFRTDVRNALVGLGADMRQIDIDNDARREELASNLAGRIDLVDEETAAKVLAELRSPALSTEQKAALLRSWLGGDAAAIGAILARG